MNKFNVNTCVFGVVCLFVVFVISSTLVQAAEPENIRVVLAGDSTVTDNAGWGAAIGGFFEPSVKVINHACGGRSSKSFVNEGRLKKD